MGPFETRGGKEKKIGGPMEGPGPGSTAPLGRGGRPLPLPAMSLTLLVKLQHRSLGPVWLRDRAIPRQGNTHIIQRIDMIGDYESEG